MRRLVDFFEAQLPRFPDVEAVNLGGGIPHPYRPGAPRYDLGGFRRLLRRGGGRAVRGGRAADPGRDRARPLPGGGRPALLVCRVKDVKQTRTNAKGPGHKFIMVDAGFNDLSGPAMYGSYHHISIVGEGAGRPPEPLVVAGPLCESGDVFTRDDQELLDPRPLPPPGAGRPAGAARRRAPTAPR